MSNSPSDGVGSTSCAKDCDGLFVVVVELEEDILPRLSVVVEKNSVRAPSELLTNILRIYIMKGCSVGLRAYGLWT